MKRCLAILAISLLCATGLAAQGYTPQTVPNVQLSDARRFTSDPDGILSPGTVAEIDRMCGELRQRGVAEVAVVVLDRVADNSLDMFAHNVLNLWGVGEKGKDNGLVVSVVRVQRDIQFETGYGLEGVLPDAICKRIQTFYMVEPLRAGDFDTGVLAGVTAVYNVLTDNQAELTALTTDNASDDPGPGIAGAMVLIFIGFVILLAVLAGRHNKNGGGGGFGGGSSGPGTGRFGDPHMGPFIGGILGGMLGGGGRGFGGGGSFGGGFGGGGSFGGGFGGGRSGGGGARSGF